ncbi:MAG: type II secretion system protein GspD [Planctomycetota bacterium]
MMTFTHRFLYIILFASVLGACKVKRGPERPAGLEAGVRAEQSGAIIVTPVDGPALKPNVTVPNIPDQKDITIPEAVAPAQDDSESDPTKLSADVLQLIPADRRISLTIPDANISEIARMLGKSSDVNVLVDDGIEKRGTFELNNVTARDAFSALAKRYELRVERQGEVIIISDAKHIKRVSKMLKANLSDFSTLDEKLKPIVGEDGTYSVSAAAKTVFVDAPADRVAQVEKLLFSLALEERQVAIEAQIFEVSFDDRLEFGVELEHLFDVGDSTLQVLQNLLPQSNNFGVTAANGPGTLTSTLQALRSLGTVELLSAPRVATVNGKEASIDVIQEVPYIQTTNTVSQTVSGGSSSTFQQVEFKEVGIRLKVTPTVLGDGSVRLDVITTVSQVASFLQNVPAIDKRTLQSIVFLADGGTMFLGGLMQRFVSDIEKKVPILGDIPLLGLIFTNIDQQVRRKELLVLLTARVIDGYHGEQLVNEFKLRYRDEKAAVELKRNGTRISGGDVPAAK